MNIFEVQPTSCVILCRSIVVSGQKLEIYMQKVAILKTARVGITFAGDFSHKAFKADTAA